MPLAALLLGIVALSARGQAADWQTLEPGVRPVTKPAGALESGPGNTASERPSTPGCSAPTGRRGRDSNHELLSAGIGLVALQHLEGGPEAQLYLSIGDVELELFGSYETSFREDDTNMAPWPIPNVLGIRRKAAAAD